MKDKMQMQTLTGKTWFITGTGSGFGRAIAHEVLARGGNVVASARNPDSLNDIITLAHDRVLPVALDVTNERQIESAITQTQKRFGRIDVLVNNAGYGFLAAIEEASEAEVRRQFDVNVFGLAAVTRAVLPLMRTAGAGHVVNISSTAGTRGSAGVGYYAASKFAVEAMSEMNYAVLINAIITRTSKLKLKMAGAKVRDFEMITDKVTGALNSIKAEYDAQKK